MSPRPNKIDIIFHRRGGLDGNETRGLSVSFVSISDEGANLILSQSSGDAIVIPWEYIDSVIKILKVYGYDKA